MFKEGKTCWLNHINIALDMYNNRVHGTTKMTPFEKSINEKLILNNNINYYRHQTTQTPSGTFVRVPDKRISYSKGYTTNWNRELFKLPNVNKTNPVTYGLVDENNEQIEGKYYEQELLKTVFILTSDNKTLESMNIFQQYE